MNLTDFIDAHTGQNYLFPGAGEDYRGQCTQIVKEWAQVNGWPVPNSGGSNRAVDYKNFAGDFMFITNTRYGVPEPGDIVIFKGPASEPDENKKYGHVSIFVTGDTETFDSFEQNWPKGSACHIQHHGYVGGQYDVIGWLHQTSQKATEAPPVAEPAPTPAPTPPATPKFIFSKNLYPGISNNGDVMQLQHYLKDLGYFPANIPLTGNYLAITKAAVATFQLQKGILPSLTAYGSGYCGPKTRAFINSN